MTGYTSMTKSSASCCCVENYSHPVQHEILLQSLAGTADKAVIYLFVFIKTRAAA